VVREERDAGAGLDLQADPLQLEALVERLAQALGHLARVARPAGGGQQHRELVAAEAGHGVARAQVAAQPGADEVLQQVAVVVAQRVVDVLEAVEVEQQHRDLAPVALRMRDRLVGAVVEEQPVGQVGDRVVQRLALVLDGLDEQPAGAAGRRREQDGHERERGQQRGRAQRGRDQQAHRGEGHEQAEPGPGERHDPVGHPHVRRVGSRGRGPKRRQVGWPRCPRPAATWS